MNPWTGSAFELVNERPHLLWKEITQTSRHMFVLNETFSVCLATYGAHIAAPFVVHSIRAYQGVVHMRTTYIIDKGQNTYHQGREKMTEDVHLFVYDVYVYIIRTHSLDVFS